MGKLNNERKIHFYYYPDLVAHFKAQSQEFKDLCDSIGKPYGYSAMNIFYMYFYTYWVHEESGTERIVYKTQI